MDKKYKERSLEDLIAKMKNAEGQCVFLVGAGCSVSAGIPSATDLVKEIEVNYPVDYKRARTKTYNDLMDQLMPKERIQLLSKYIKSAKVNWGNLALAQMFKEGVLDRILTVNFDPLLVRACAMVGFFPAVYDLAVAANFNENRIAEKSIFYLNGQHAGFSMLNSNEELDAHKDRLSEIVRNTTTNRIWIIVGYSGESDPLLDEIIWMAENRGFDNGLYWVGRSETPTERQLSLLKFRNTFYLRYVSSDLFLSKLAEGMNVFPPTILSSPVDFLEGIIKENIDFSSGGAFADKLKNDFESAIERYRSNSDAVSNSVEHNDDKYKKLLLSGGYQEVIDAHENGLLSDGLASWAYSSKASRLAQDLSDLLKKDNGFDWEVVENYESLIMQSSYRSISLSKGLLDGVEYNHLLVFYNLAVAFRDIDYSKRDFYIKSFIDGYKVVVQKEKFDYLRELKIRYVVIGDLYLRYHVDADLDYSLVFSKELFSIVDDLSKSDTPEGEVDIRKIKLRILILVIYSMRKLGVEEYIAFARQYEKEIHSYLESDLGGFCYNYACFQSILGNDEQAVEYLKKAKEIGKLPNTDHIGQDRDLDFIRHGRPFQEWFNNIQEHLVV